MSHGLRIEDLAWQAFQAGAAKASPNQDFNRVSFLLWWNQRTEQGCALPACDQCGFDPGLKIAQVWILKLDKDPSSLNARVYNAGHTRYAYAKERDEWHWMIKHERLKQKIPKAMQKRRVTLTRNYGGQQKERDVDNLSGGMKNCVDAVVREGLLVNDSPQYAELHYKQNRVSERSSLGLWIQIEEFA